MELKNKKLRKGGFTISSGDIFEVPLNNGKKGYFQFLYKDDYYMAGHVIRAFQYYIKQEQNIKVETLTNYSIKFIAHTRVFQGLIDGLWNKVGNIPIESDFEQPVFRQTNDTYAKVKKSNNWFIWQFTPDNRTNIGELTDEFKNLPVSGILPPFAIVKWLETGWHGFKEPE